MTAPQDPDTEIGLTTIPVHYLLRGGVRAAVEAAGGTINDLIGRAFLELADCGASFDVFYFYLTVEYPSASLNFEINSKKYSAGGELYLTISLVEGPLLIPDEDIPAWIREDKDG